MFWHDYYSGRPTGAQLGIFKGTPSLGGVFAQIFPWWLVEKIGRRFTIVYFTHPETLRIALEEISNVFGGKHAVKQSATIC